MTVQLKWNDTSIKLPKSPQITVNRVQLKDNCFPINSTNINRIKVDFADIFTEPIDFREFTFSLKKGDFIAISNPKKEQLEYKSAYIVTEFINPDIGTQSIKLTPTNNHAKELLVTQSNTVSTPEYSVKLYRITTENPRKSITPTNKIYPRRLRYIKPNKIVPQINISEENKIKLLKQKI